MHYPASGYPPGHGKGGPLPTKYRCSGSGASVFTPIFFLFSTYYFRINDFENIIWRYNSFYQRDFESLYGNVSTIAFGSQTTTNSNHTVRNLVIDHCGFFYGRDESLDVSGSAESANWGADNNITDVSLQYNIFAGKKGECGENAAAVCGSPNRAQP